MNIRVFFIIITQFSLICTFIVSIKSLKERITRQRESILRVTQGYCERKNPKS